MAKRTKVTRHEVTFDQDTGNNTSTTISVVDQVGVEQLRRGVKPVRVRNVRYKTQDVPNELAAINTCLLFEFNLSVVQDASRPAGYDPSALFCWRGIWFSGATVTTIQAAYHEIIPQGGLIDVKRRPICTDNQNSTLYLNVWNNGMEKADRETDVLFEIEWELL
jgi:hypothetical protein